jgi:toxin YoeB
MKILRFEKRAQKELKWMEKHEKILLIKVNILIEDIKLHPYSGIGKPEALRFELSGYWSRRINREHRLVYKVEGDLIIIIASCRFHY